MSIDKINKSTQIPDNYKYYWNYQYRLGSEILVDYLKKHDAFSQGIKIAEIGSAEAGVLAAFVEKGAEFALATDIAQNRLDMGKKIADISGMNIDFSCHNILTEQIPTEWAEKFDLVLLRDVIEHLDDTRLALRNISKLIKPGGHLFVTFPPYYSPFGGHQHTVANKTGKLPWIHILPDPLFYLLLKGGRKNDIGEVKRLQNIKLNPKKFSLAAISEGYTIVHEEYYLLRPVFKMKFGLPSIKLTKIKKLPMIKNYFSLESAFLLQKK